MYKVGKLNEIAFSFKDSRIRILGKRWFQKGFNPDGTFPPPAYNGVQFIGSNPKSLAVFFLFF